MTRVFLSRAGRAAPNDIAQRIPELAPLRHATICVFGLGCLGAPSVMEFARCGVKKVRVVDHDIVDPGTICRWPFGLQSAGLPKAVVLKHAVGHDYPFTKVEDFVYRVGAVRNPGDQRRSEQHIMGQITEGASLIYDATAEVGVQHYLSDYAVAIGVPYICVDATYGGWGGRTLRIMPGSTAGCWMCYRLAVRDKKIPEPPMQPNGEIQPVGCADPTFTGAGFDMTQIALTAVRLAVSTLCANTPAGYPAANWDAMTIALRDQDGTLIPPQFHGYKLERHLECSRCNPI